MHPLDFRVPFPVRRSSGKHSEPELSPPCMRNRASACIVRARLEPRQDELLAGLLRTLARNCASTAWYKSDIGRHGFD